MKITKLSITSPEQRDRVKRRECKGTRNET